MGGGDSKIKLGELQPWERGGNRTKFQYVQKIGKWEPMGNKLKRQGCLGGVGIF